MMTKLRELRYARNLRQLDIALALSINANTISAIERGHLAAPKNLVDPICTFFGVKREEIFTANRMAVLLKEGHDGDPHQRIRAVEGTNTKPK